MFKLSLYFLGFNTNFYTIDSALPRDLGNSGSELIDNPLIILIFSLKSLNYTIKFELNSNYLDILKYLFSNYKDNFRELSLNSFTNGTGAVNISSDRNGAGAENLKVNGVNKAYELNLVQMAKNLKNLSPSLKSQFNFGLVYQAIDEVEIDLKGSNYFNNGFLTGGPDPLNPNPQKILALHPYKQNILERLILELGSPSFNFETINFNEAQTF